MIKGYIFDYGGTLDTDGCHWGQMLWHAYERNNIQVSEQEFRDAYVYAERTLGNNTIIRPDFTFYKTLEVKIRLEMEWLMVHNKWKVTEAEYKEKHEEVLTDLYDKVKVITTHSRNVLTELKKKYPMVLVSNFYGNINEVLKEFQMDSLF